MAWVVSGRGADGLRGQAAQLAAYLEQRPELRPADVAWALATTRAKLDHRAVVTGPDCDQLLQGLSAVAAGTTAPGVATGRVTDGVLALAFSGQGSQRPGMGRELYDTFSVYADAFDEACAHLDTRLDRPVRDVVFAAGTEGEPGPLDQTVYTQAGLFALEVALFRLVESLGVRPGLLIGHSVGEIAAAHVAGILSLPDAAILVAERGRLMQALPAGGAMVSVAAPEEEVAALLVGHEERACLAAVNGPVAVVVSGEEDTVLAIAAVLAGRGRKTRRLRVSHAFHSPRMEPMLAAFAEVAAGLSYRPPAIPIASNLAGALDAADAMTSSDYWVEHVRRPVRFRAGVAALVTAGVRRFAEIGPDAVLAGMVSECLDDPDAAVVVPLLRRGRPERQALTEGLGRLYVHGVSVDWPGRVPARPAAG